MTITPPRRLFSPAGASARLQPSATPAPSHQQTEPAPGQGAPSNLAPPSLTPRGARYLRRSLNYSTPQNSAALVAQSRPNESAQAASAAQNERNVRRRLNPNSEAAPAASQSPEPVVNQQVASTAAAPRTPPRMARRNAINLGTPVNLMEHLDAAAVSPGTTIAGNRADVDDDYTAPAA